MHGARQLTFILHVCPPLPLPWSMSPWDEWSTWWWSCEEWSMVGTEQSEDEGWEDEMRVRERERERERCEMREEESETRVSARAVGLSTVYRMSRKITTSQSPSGSCHEVFEALLRGLCVMY